MNPHYGLWGSVLERVSLDLLPQAVSLDVRVPSASGDRFHRLELLDVTTFRFFSTIPSPWTYAELTEIEVTASGSPSVTAEIMLWSDDAGIVVEAASVLLDGEVLQPLTDRD